MTETSLKEANLDTENTYSNRTYYAKMSKWTCDEAVMFVSDEIFSSLNIILLEQSIEMHRERFHIPPQKNIDSPFLVRDDLDAIKIRKFLDRSIIEGEIIYTTKNDTIYIKPLDFINWCKEKLIPFPQELEMLVRKYHQPSKEELDERHKWQKIQAEVEALREENYELKQDVSNPNKISPVSWRKVVIGLLMKSYKVDSDTMLSMLENHKVNKPFEIPLKTKRVTVADIKRAINELGIDIDDQTLRKVINDAIPELEKPMKAKNE